MADLTVNWAGLTLKSPVIVGSCNLTTDPGNAKKMEQAGAGAIVFKSLFEEQIELESLQLEREMTQFNERYAEMLSIFPNLKHAGIEEHLVRFAKVKSIVAIPVIASLNAVHWDSWIKYAKKLEEVGADALEVNFYYIPASFDKEASDVENEQLAVLAEIKKTVKIPVVVKISPYYSNVLNFLKKLDEHKADGVVMFNRLFQPDIDLNDQKNIYPYNLSVPSDQRVALRFTALTYGKIKASLTAATGIHEWSDAVKMILVGADAFQMVSTVYKNGFKKINEINQGIENWMQQHNYTRLNDFKGKLAKINLKDPFAYYRAQYIDILLSSDDILKQNIPV